MSQLRTLTLLEEHKLHSLLPQCDDMSRLEGSGLERVGNQLYVVFDNMGLVAKVDRDLQSIEQNSLSGPPGHIGYESLTYDPVREHFFLLIEALRVKKHCYQAKLIECDRDLQPLTDGWLEFDFDGENKGFEGVLHIRRGEAEFLLALCEGNHCCAGKRGREAGNGRIQVFQRESDGWHPAGVTIALPPEADFIDYADVALNEQGQLAVVSQQSALLWVGQLDIANWSIDGPGVCFDFPRTSKGKIRYGNLEGICWDGARRVITVTDKRKSSEKRRFDKTDQSLQVFELRE